MNGLLIALRQDNGKYLYEQIYGYIKEEIRKGRLRFGERLPSTRSLSEFLQVSRSTVELAYGQLLSEGYIEARPYRGYFVCQVEELFDFTDRGAAREAGMLSGEPLRENDAADGRGRPVCGGRQNSVADGTYLCDFSPDSIDMTVFPYATWKKITKEILVDANSEMFSSGSPKGDYALRETIARYLHSSRGVNCHPEQVIIGAGNDYILMLLEKILGRHVEVAMENPTYRKAYRIFASFAYPIASVEMDGFGMSVEGLRKTGAKVAYVMPSHQYPMGIVMPIGRRMELLKWAGEQEDRYVIEDDYDSEFRFKGKPIPSLQASDRLGKVIYTGTFSKSIAPAIRIGYMVLPLPLLRIYEERCRIYSTTVSRIDQRILNEFIAGGHFERHLNRMRKVYREKHDLLVNGCRGMGHDFVLSGENAGLHLLLQDRRGRSEKMLVERAGEAGVKVYGLSEFYTDGVAPKRESGTVVLGYAAPDKGQIQTGLDLLKKVWA